jgi:putative FmdB family regulatory protein
MPIYEYERADGTRFEIRQGFHDEPLTVCPDTGQPVRRIVSPAPIIFKGSGWYITDSRPAAKSESASGDTSSSATSASDKGSSGASASDSSAAKKGEAAA